MVVTAFPPLDTADKTGLLAIGGDLDIETLLLAYSSGIFPWPLDEETLAWFSPPKRALLFLEDFHVPDSLRRSARRNYFRVKYDTCFSEVVTNCAQIENRTGQKGTWITTDIIKAYCKLHEAGHAHSIECFINDDLVGGMYGVAIGKMFAGESMFYNKPDASKFCLWSLVELLKKNGVSWMDCQVMTPHMKRFGAKEVTRKKFLGLLSESLDGAINFAL